MRMLLTIELNTDSANPLISDGTMAKMMQETFEQLKPEAAYFAPMDGCRAGFIVFDMEDPSQMPALTEPLFQGPHAKVNLVPCMDMADLQKGLAALQSK